MLELRSRRSRLIAQLIATLIVIPFLLPLIWMVQGSLAGAGLHNFSSVLSVGSVPTFFRNSAIIAAGTILIATSATMLASYAFAKLRLRYKEVFFYILLGALTLPEAVITIPLFVTIQRLGLFNTYWAVILPLAALTIPFNIMLTRGYIEGLPDELLEASQVDGCSSFGTFWRIVLPLTRPVLGVVVMWTLLMAWNEYLLPLIFLQTPQQQTITLLPQYFMGQFGGDPSKIIAASTIAAVPEIVVFLLTQRWIQRGIAAGAIK
jgi:raffinose/stachyose/melibiose transport system permease protein